MSISLFTQQLLAIITQLRGFGRDMTPLVPDSEINFGLVIHICVVKSSFHFPSDVYVRRETLYSPIALGGDQENSVRPRCVNLNYIHQAINNYLVYSKGWCVVSCPPPRPITINEDRWFIAYILYHGIIYVTVFNLQN